MNTPLHIRFLNKRILTLGHFFKSEEPVEKGVEFFFYTDGEDKANNLVVELLKLGYEIYGVHACGDLTSRFSTTGCNRNLKLRIKRNDSMDRGNG